MMDVLYTDGNEQQRHWATLAVERNWGATMVLTEPDAGSDVGAGRHQGRRTARRHLASRRSQALHHLRRLRRPVREHRPPRPRAAGRGGAGHQGTEPVPGAEVPARSRDRSARAAQRRVRHRSRAQDGPDGVGHLRADVRPARLACGRLAGRRRAQRHRADVQDHGVRANGGGLQGDCDAVHRLSERAGLREGTRRWPRPTPMSAGR